MRSFLHSQTQQSLHILIGSDEMVLFWSVSSLLRKVEWDMARQQAVRGLNSYIAH